VKICNVASDVFVLGISEKLEFSGIRPQNCSVRAYEVKRHRSAFEKIGELVGFEKSLKMRGFFVPVKLL
jgi:hypothetical protein